jgi:uncharacterized membrane protein
MPGRDFSITVDIAAPAADVWAVMSDVERWPEWTPSVKSIEILDKGPLKPGSRIRIRQPKLPPAVWTMVAVEANTVFTWKTGSALASVTARHFVETVENGSRVILSLHFAGLLGAFVAWLTRDLNERYLHLEATGLKRRSEEAAFRGE